MHPNHGWIDVKVRLPLKVGEPEGANSVCITAPEGSAGRCNDFI
jgi:hypothetical protein